MTEAGQTFYLAEMAHEVYCDLQPTRVDVTMTMFQSFTDANVLLKTGESNVGCKKGLNSTPLNYSLRCFSYLCFYFKEGMRLTFMFFLYSTTKVRNKI